MLRRFRADLHIHTCLSPCADWEMSPRKIVEESSRKGLDIIAVCDHNSAENTPAAVRAGSGMNICVIPGMEVCSREEVHLLALFDKPAAALKMQEVVYAHLPGINNPDIFGYQVVANEWDEVQAENQRLLIGATRLAVYGIVEQIHSLGGICIASHVDRPAFGIISQLGFIPPDLALDAVEVSGRITPADALRELPGLQKFPCLTSSDAHFPQDIGKVSTVFHLAEPTFAEILMALRGENGRRINSV